MFSELGELKHLNPSADEVQNKIAALQKFITDKTLQTLKQVWRVSVKSFRAIERIVFQNRIFSKSYFR